MESLNKLAMDCVYTILSLSSPRDVCRSATTCSELRSVAESDFVWENFLPSDYHDIIARANLSLIKFRSKKELYFMLCESLLIDGGTKIFTLDINSGLKSYILSAQELSIAWSSDPLYWSWKNVPQSRFKQIAELRNTSWLEIHGKINTKCLSPNTTYGAYLIFDVAKRAYGLDTIPMETTVQIGDDNNNQVCNNRVNLQHNYGTKQLLQKLMYYNRTMMLMSSVNQGLHGSDTVLSGERNDGWMEIELGQFFCDGIDEKIVKMGLMEIKGYHLKGGLIIEGIEIKPLYLSGN